MSIFGGIGSAISSAVSCVCSAISGIGSAISSVVGGIGAKIASFATALVPGLREIAAIIEVIGLICTVVDGIARILGLKEDNEDTTDFTAVTMRDFPGKRNSNGKADSIYRY